MGLAYQRFKAGSDTAFSQGLGEEVMGQDGNQYQGFPGGPEDTGYNNAPFQGGGQQGKEHHSLYLIAMSFSMPWPEGAVNHPCTWALPLLSHILWLAFNFILNFYFQEWDINRSKYNIRFNICFIDLKLCVSHRDLNSKILFATFKGNNDILLHLISNIRTQLIY